MQKKRFNLIPLRFIQKNFLELKVIQKFNGRAKEWRIVYVSFLKNPGAAK